MFVCGKFGQQNKTYELHERKSEKRRSIAVLDRVDHICFVDNV
jgi:hypothetical protein